MQAVRDQNNIPVILGLLNTDGSTLTPICANPSNNGVCIDDDTTGSDNGGTQAGRDQSFVTSLMAVSSSDGVTPVTLYVDSSNNLLINSN